MRVTPGFLKLKHAVAVHGPQVAVGLLVVGAVLAGVAGWHVTHPSTTTDEREVGTVRTAAATSAVVTGNSSLYAQGTRLHDQSVYLTSATPEARVQVTTTFGRPGEVTQRLELVYRATRNGETFWQTTRPLATASRNASDGQIVTAGTFDTRAVRDRVARYRREVGDAGSVRVSLRVVTDYRTDRYDGQMTAAAPLELSADAYSFGDGLERTRTHRVRTAPEPAGSPLLALERGGGWLVLDFPGLALGLLGVAAWAGAIGARRHYRRADADLASRRYLRARYDEWISVGRLPTCLQAHEAIGMNTLEDLVDVAIDSRKRVVYDGERQVYAVVDGQFVYYVDEGGRPADD